MLTFSVSNQTIARTDNFKPAGESVLYLTATFSFLTDEWTADGVGVSAIFRAVVDDVEQTPYTVLIEDGACVVPWECLAFTDKFYITVSVVGTVGDKVITTNTARVLIDKTGYVDGETPEEPTPSVYAQLIADYEETTGLIAQATEQLAEATALVETATTAAENAEASATAAASSAQSAATSAESAQTAATTATQSATDAAESATASQTAQTAAETAQSAAESASTTAQNAAETATTAATTATTAASTATTAATSASNSADAAQTSATAAATSEANAAASEQNAAASATTAQTYATAAAESATAAAASATEAGTAATTATTAAENAAELVEDAAETLTELQSEISDLQAQIYASFPTDNASGDIVTFTDGADDIPVIELVANINPVQESGTPSPTNPLAISGWTGCDIYKSNSNILKLVESEMGVMGSNRYFPFSIAAGSYIIKCNSAYSISAGTRVVARDSNLGFIKDIAASYGFGSTAGASYTFTVTEEEARKIAYISFDPTYNWLTFAYIQEPQFQITEGSTATAYEPYNGEIKTISWQTEAGTVYGGSLNVTTGVLTVTWGYIDSYDGETLNGAWLSTMDEYVEGGTPTTGAGVAYELDTPITYQLTATEIKTLLGNNTIFANCGEVNVNYRADTTLYIDKKLSE